jgi:hypothetical protein
MNANNSKDPASRNQINANPTGTGTLDDKDGKVPRKQAQASLCSPRVAACREMHKMEKLGDPQSSKSSKDEQLDGETTTFPPLQYLVSPAGLRRSQEEVEAKRKAVAKPHYFGS